MDKGNELAPAPSKSGPPALGEVTFTNDQLKAIEAQYPQRVLSPTTAEAYVRQYFGQQDVVEFIRRRTRGMSPKQFRESRRDDDIPTPR